MQNNIITADFGKRRATQQQKIDHDYLVLEIKAKICLRNIVALGEQAKGVAARAVVEIETLQKEQAKTRNEYQDIIHQMNHLIKNGGDAA
jgi:hypothetical protein